MPPPSSLITRIDEHPTVPREMFIRARNELVIGTLPERNHIHEG